MNWEIVLKIPPHSPVSDPVGSPASLLWGSPVNVEPGQIWDVKEPVVVYDPHHHDPNAHLCCKRGKRQVESVHRLLLPELHNRWSWKVGDLLQ